MPSLGSLSVFSIDGDLFPAAAKMSPFTQFGANGIGFIKGAKRQPTSELKTVAFSDDRSAQDDFKRACADLVGTVVTITRDVGPSPITVENCVIVSYKITKSGAGSGLPGDATFVTEVDWEVVVPFDW